MWLPSSIFLPLLGVILGRLAFMPPGTVLLHPAHSARPIHAVPIALWLAGIAFYHSVPSFAPVLGAALPTLALCFVLAYATRPALKHSKNIF